MTNSINQLLSQAQELPTEKLLGSLGTAHTSTQVWNHHDTIFIERSIAAWTLFQKAKENPNNPELISAILPLFEAYLADVPYARATLETMNQTDEIVRILLPFLENPSDKAEVTVWFIINGLGLKAIPAAEEALRQRKSIVYVSAIFRELSKKHPDAEELISVLPTLSQALNDENMGVVDNVTRTLINLNHQSADFSLVEALRIVGSRIDDSKDSSNRRVYSDISKSIVEKLSNASPSIIPILGELLTHEDIWVRTYVYWALSYITSKHPECEEITKYLPTIQIASQEELKALVNVSYWNNRAIPDFAESIVEARAKALRSKAETIDQDQISRTREITKANLTNPQHTEKIKSKKFRNAHPSAL